MMPAQQKIKMVRFLPWIEANVRFLVNNHPELKERLEHIHGVEWVDFEGKYAYNVSFGDAFSREEVEKQVIEVINKYFEE